MSLLEHKKETDGILRTLKERLIKNFLDLIIMSEIEKGPLSGYDVITLVFDKFHFLVSSGTVYALLYSLERKGLIEGTLSKKKMTYRLTEKGKFTIHTIMSEPSIQYCTRTLVNSFNNKHA